MSRVMDGADRHDLFDAARRRAELTVHELWLRYLALGGTHDAIDLDAYLHGLAAVEPGQQDVLAVALNERLEELYLAVRVPLVAAASGRRGRIDLETVVEDLLQRDGRPD